MLVPGQKTLMGLETPPFYCHSLRICVRWAETKGAKVFRKIDNLKLLAALGTAAVVVFSTTPALADVTFSGILDNATTQVGRVTRNATASSCGTVKTYPGTTGSGARNYDAYTFTNPTGSSQCYTINVTSITVDTFVVAYLGAFNPANIQTNYLGDLGSSLPQSFGIDVPAGQTVTLVVSAVNTGTDGYSLTVVGPTSAPATVPTLSEWAMILFGTILAGGAALYIQRRRQLA